MDLCYGFNVFWQRHLPVLRLDSTMPPQDGAKRPRGDGFEIETLPIRVTMAGLAVVEVPSFEHSRIHGVSKPTAFSDDLRMLWMIFIERHARQAAVRPPHEFSNTGTLEEFASFQAPSSQEAE